MGWNREGGSASGQIWAVGMHGNPSPGMCCSGGMGGQQVTGTVENAASDILLSQENPQGGPHLGAP